MKLVVFLTFLALAAPAAAQGFVFPEITDNPALRACGAPLLDPNGTMTKQEQATAQWEVYECIRRWEAWRQLACNGSESKLLTQPAEVAILCSVSWQEWLTMDWRP